MPYNSIIAIILASGKGSRFGMPKAEAGFEGISFPDRITATLQEAGIKHIHLAKGYDTPDMLATLLKAREEILLSGCNYSGYLVFPVDFPFVLPATIKEIAKAFIQNPRAVIRPFAAGRAGHPIIIPASLLQDSSPHPEGLKGLIRSSAYLVIDVPVADSGILRNINTLEDL